MKSSCCSHDTDEPCFVNLTVGAVELGAFAAAWAANECCETDCEVDVLPLLSQECGTLTYEECATSATCVQAPAITGDVIVGISCTICKHVNTAVDIGILTSCEAVAGCYTTASGACDHCTAFPLDSPQGKCPGTCSSVDGKVCVAHASA